MTPNQLKSRQKFVEATPLPDRASCTNVNRREKNHVEQEDSYSDTFDTFFEYEEELSQLKPSNSQANTFADRESCSFVEMEELEQESPSVYSHGVEMQEIEEAVVPSVAHVEMEDVSENNNDYMNVKGFNFIQCEYMKKDGHRCKRQAPKGSDICSIHKKIIKKSKVI